MNLSWQRTATKTAGKRGPEAPSPELMKTVNEIHTLTRMIYDLSHTRMVWEQVLNESLTDWSALSLVIFVFTLVWLWQHRQLLTYLALLTNDAHGLVTARYLESMGCNLFNFSFEHTIDEIRQLTGAD